MTNQDFKHILVSIIIGACMAFFSTLFSELANLLKTHSQQILPAAATTVSYLFQKHIS